MDFPNLLVLSQAVPETCYAGSLLLYRLLREYPVDKLLVIGPAPQAHPQKLACRYETLELPLRRWDNTRFSKAVRSLRLLGCFPGPSLRQVERRLHGFRPQIVVSVMQTSSFYGLAARFARARALPLALIVHDLAEKFEQVLPPFATLQHTRNGEIYRAARRRFCVSPEMCDHLQTTYGVPGEVLYPNRSEDLGARDPRQNATLKVPGVLTVGYAGTLAYGYGAQLRRMLPAFERSGCRLRIYSATPLQSDHACLENAGYAPPEQTWARVKEHCDAVILPYTWNEEYRALYETHFPSKLPEYLALGMPVLVVGPPTATGVRWASERPHAVLTVSEPSEAAWENALCALRDDASLRQKVAANAWQAGMESFNPVRIREGFISALEETATATAR